MADTQGKIIKALSGFYYVKNDTGIVECKPRGKLRNEKLVPLVGDNVVFSMTGKKGVIEQVLPRKNSFLRPPVANVDVLVLLAANSNPVTDPFLIDRISAIAGSRNVPLLLCVNKTDLDSGEELCRIYRHAGFRVISTSAATGEGIEELCAEIRGKTVAFTGNSGVGKSSVLNAICPQLSIETGEVSQKLGRGRHTTRHVELYPLPDGTCIADTPGFASFDTEQMELVVKEELQYAFPDFAAYIGQCRYRDCAHLKEPDCRIRQALADGELEQTRYDSYVRLYEHAKDIKLWNLPK